MPLSGFSFASAYTANLAFMIISTSSSAAGSLGIFRQKWLNWISAQTQYSNGFMDGINWAAAIGSQIYVFELQNLEVLFDSVPLIGSLLIHLMSIIFKKNKYGVPKLRNMGL